MTKGNYSIRMVPISIRATAKTVQTLNTGLAQAEKITESSTNTDYVKYENVFGNGTILKYTPDYEGVKEDIILTSNVGNQFVFEFYTQNLIPSTDGTTVTFIDKNSREPVAELSPIYVYDSFGVNTTNNHYTVQTISSGRYRITLVIDEGFLSRSDVVYPVYIDPTISFPANDYDNVSIYSVCKNGTSTEPYVTSEIAPVGKMNCKVYRAFVTFPGILSNETYQSLNAAQILKASFGLFTATGSSYLKAYMYTGASTSNQDFDAIEYLKGMPRVQVGQTSPSFATSFDVTQAFRFWKSGIYDPDKGIVLVNETERKECVVFLSSANTAGYRPSASIQYTENKNVSLDVTHYRQSYNTSCGAASCRIALIYEGVPGLTDRYSDDDILSCIGLVTDQGTNIGTILSNNLYTDAQNIVPGVNLYLNTYYPSLDIRYAWNGYATTYSYNRPETHNGHGFNLSNMEYTNFLLTNLANDHPVVVLLKINDKKYFQYMDSHYVVVKSVTYNTATQQYDVTVVDPHINPDHPETVTLPVSELRRYSNLHSSGRTIHYRYWE